MDHRTNFEPINKKKLSAMNELKDALVPPPVLALPISSGHVILDTAACDKHVGCMLLQKQEDDTARTIEFWSSTPNNAEKRFGTRPTDCQAIVRSAQILCPYLQEMQYGILSYEEFLKWTLSLSDSTGRLAR